MPCDYESYGAACFVAALSERNAYGTTCACLERSLQLPAVLKLYTIYLSVYYVRIVSPPHYRIKYFEVVWKCLSAALWVIDGHRHITTSS